MTDRPLAGRVALVAGATRGCGRAIAVELGALGATVYGSGRSTRAGRSPMDRPETIEETAERVTAAGGEGIAVRCDHADPDDVATLVDRIRAGHGRLDSRWGYVGNMFVDAAHRGGGIGAALLNAIIATAEERDYARLVLSPTERAVPFYRRAGFVVPDDAVGGHALLVRVTS